MLKSGKVWQTMTSRDQPGRMLTDLGRPRGNPDGAQSETGNTRSHTTRSTPTPQVVAGIRDRMKVHCKQMILEKTGWEGQDLASPASPYPRTQEQEERLVERGNGQRKSPMGEKERSAE